MLISNLVSGIITSNDYANGFQKPFFEIMAHHFDKKAKGVSEK